ASPGGAGVGRIVTGRGGGPPEVAGSVSFEVVGPPPIPPPVPPAPAPPVGGKAAAFVVVEETADATADRALFFTDPRLAEVVRDQKLKYQVLDQHATDAAGRPPAGAKGQPPTAEGREVPRAHGA